MTNPTSPGGAGEALAKKLQRAHDELSDAVDRQWHGYAALRLSIPARPDHDTDLIIGSALREAIALLTEQSRQQEAAAWQIVKRVADLSILFSNFDVERQI